MGKAAQSKAVPAYLEDSEAAVINLSLPPFICHLDL